MSRPLRWIEPGFHHHVMNRGLAGMPLYNDDQDREAFLELVAECGPRWDVWAQVFCVMDNHYHLVMLDDAGRLSRAMRHIDGVYTQRFNRKVGRDGPLMRGRYKSRVVQREGYLQELVRYLHANPVDAGIVKRAVDYPWSSHRSYLGIEQRKWLRTDQVCEILGLGDPERLLWFDEFVHERIEPAMMKELAPKHWSSLLGDESFRERAREAVRTRPELSRREIGEGARLAALDVNDVLRTACKLFEMPRVALVSGKRGSRNLPRLITVLACRDLTPTRTRELGTLFGVREATVSALSGRARAAVRDEPEARELWEQLIAVLLEYSQIRT